MRLYKKLLYTSTIDFKKKKWRKIIDKKGYAGSILMDLGSDTTNHELLIAKFYVNGSSKDVLFL